MLLSHSTVGNVILRHRRKTDRRTSVPPHLPFLFAGNSVATGGFPGTRLLHKARPGCAGVSGPQPPCGSGPAGALWQQQTQKHGTLGTARGRRAQHAAMETKRNQASSRAAWLTKLTPPVCHNPNLRRSALPESVRWLTTSWGPQGTGDGKVWKKRQWGGPGGGEPARWGPGWGCRGRWRHRVLHGEPPGLLPSSVQFSCSVVSNSATPWTVAHQASLSITSSRSLLKLMCIVSVMPSNHLILHRPLLLPPSIFPSIRVFSKDSALRIRWPKYWSFSFSISPSNEYLD